MMMLQYKLSGHKTKRVVFENAFSVMDSASLEQLKELTAKRRLIEESINQTSHITEATAREMYGGLTSRHEQDLQRLEQYIPLLMNLIVQVASANSTRSLVWCIPDLKIQWTSILTSSPAIKLTGPKFYQVDILNYELAMTLFIYGLILRDRAFEVLSEDLSQSVALLKRAAGVYKYVNDMLVLQLQAITSQEKPPEVNPAVPHVMGLICLAEAQALAIKKAETREISAGAMAKLHYGISQFLDDASTLIQSAHHNYKDISSKFVEFIHTCRTLYELRSCIYAAESYKECNEIGISIGLLERALNSVLKNTPNDPSWREVFKKEVKDLSEMIKRYKEENAFGWRQKVPLDFELPALEGTKMATPISYEPPIWEREISFKT